MEKTITQQIDEIVSEFCEKYCKYPEIAMAEKKDPDDAEDLLYEKYCGGCPLNRM